MKKLVLRFIVKYLKDTTLNAQERSLLTAAIIDQLRAIPVGAILKKDTDSTLIVNGKRIDPKTAFALHASAKRVLGERAFKLVNEQIRFESVNIGIFQGLTPEQNLFAKAALWEIGEHVKALEELAGNVSVDNEDDDI